MSCSAGFNPSQRNIRCIEKPVRCRGGHSCSGALLLRDCQDRWDQKKASRKTHAYDAVLEIETARPWPRRFLAHPEHRARELTCRRHRCSGDRRPRDSREKAIAFQPAFAGGIGETGMIAPAAVGCNACW